VRSAAVLLCFAALAAAAPAAAQQNSDPIGALLERQGKVLPEDEATAEESRSRPAAPAPEDSLPATPTAPAPRLTAPVHVEETGKSPDGPPTPRDLAYESRLRASFASAQRFQGSLDGSWTIAGPTGDLYALELVDRGRNVVEGAWRDLRRKGAVGASGFVDEIERVGSEMTLRFAGGASATLESQPDGRWTGQLTEAGQTSSVTLRKSGP
jgi:hypothetical protein